MSKAFQTIKPSSEIHWVRDYLDGFYRWMYERQSIWHRRFVEKKDPPWTFDKWLRDFKFTNVYRELDRGTLWFVEYVITNNLMWRDKVFATIAYRLLNRIDTFEEIGYIPTYTTWNPKKYYKDLMKIASTGNPVFTNAHSLPPAPKGKTKVYGHIRMLHSVYAHFDTLCSLILKAKSMEDVFNILRTIETIGPFFAYEICCDWMYKAINVIPFTENDWVNVGPGAKQGIELIFPNREVMPLDKAIPWLRDHQEMMFREIDVEFPYLYEGKLLTLRAIEHSLCEYSKYVKLSVGVGRYRLKFDPKE